VLVSAYAGGSISRMSGERKMLGGFSWRLQAGVETRFAFVLEHVQGMAQ